MIFLQLPDVLEQFRAILDTRESLTKTTMMRKFIFKTKIV